MLCKTKKKNTFVTEISKGIKNVERSLRLIGKGEVLEWLKRHAWKACIRQKRITGSNPVLSAKKRKTINKLLIN